MTTVSKNIKFLRKKERLTQEQLAEKIGIKRSLIGAYEEGRADPRLNNLMAISKLFNVTVDLLISCDISERTEEVVQEQSVQGTSGFKILSITVDSQNNENIELVPYKASAGYLNGYSDPQFVEKLPKFQLPTLPNVGTFRAFEIIGDSMLPLCSGTYIIGQYVEKLDDLKNDTTYILLTKNEGVVYKRIVNLTRDSGNLLLISDNKAYAPYEVAAEDVLEIWEAKSYISNTFPDPSRQSLGNTDAEISFEKLTSMVLDLQKEVIKIKTNQGKILN